VALSHEKIQSIKADYEVGIVTLDTIGKTYGVAKFTVIRLAKRLNWERGKSDQIVTKAIHDTAKLKIIEREGAELYDATGIYLENIKVVDKAIKYNLASFYHSVKKHGRDMPKSEGDRLKSIQQFLECCARTYRINLEGRRLALGLDKDQPTDGPTININIGKTEDLSVLPDNELDIIVSELN